MTREELREMPKLDLHCHLDGSLTLASMSAMLGRDVAPEEIRVTDDCGSLAEYLEKFDLPVQCLQTADHLRTASRDFLLEAAKEHVCYMEVRFAPLLSVHEGLATREVIEAVLDGISDATAICHVPCQVITCAMRHHSDEDNLAMMKVSREFLGAGVCAVDLAGDEASFPMQNFKDLFAEAKKLGLPFTIHAGECGNVENVELAVAYGTKRIGHGIALRGHADAMAACASAKIGIEMCPISNLQTKASTLRDYPMRAFSDAGLCVTVNTDNRTVSNTTLTRELEHIQTQYGFSDEELYTFEKNAAEAAFADDSVKADLLRKLRLWHDGRKCSN